MIAMETALLKGGDSAGYMPAGELRFHCRMPGLAENYHRYLDLENAVAGAEYRCGEVRFRREFFACHPAQVMVIHFHADKPGMVSFRVQLKSLLVGNYCGDADAIWFSGHCPLKCRYNFASTQWSERFRGPGGVNFQMRLKAYAHGGCVTAQKNGLLRVTDADEVTLVLAFRSDFRGFQSPLTANCALAESLCLKDIEKIAQDTALYPEHQKDYQTLYNRSRLEFPVIAEDELCTDERIRRCEREKKVSPNLVALLYHFGVT